MKIGILGNGQLGRMAAMEGARLGLQTIIYAPDNKGPANQVVSESHVGDWDDENALARFADAVDVITYEFENVPVATARFLENHKPVFPQPVWLERAQHRIAEKAFFHSKNLPIAGYVAWDSSLKGSSADVDVIIKTCAGGYDGKGQWRVGEGEIYPDLPDTELIVEETIDLAGELSVIVCKDQKGNTACYDPSWNVHKNGILATSSVPAPSHAEDAKKLALQLIEGEDFVGVMALELFLTKDGRLLANEMAPRPHNSGHWTIDACLCSQFEQQMRALAGMELGGTKRHSDAIMTNLIGDDVYGTMDWLRQPEVALHLYGKSEVRAGRKMGHVTRLKRKD